jgi:hypothetical protein
MRCINCHTENDLKAKFCENCGQSLGLEAEYKNPNE